MKTQYRAETDLLGTRQIPADTLWGIHTARALENFQIAGKPAHPELVKAYGAVKLACFQTNQKLGFFPEPEKAPGMKKQVNLLKKLKMKSFQSGMPF